MICLLYNHADFSEISSNFKRMISNYAKVNLKMYKGGDNFVRARVRVCFNIIMNICMTECVFSLDFTTGHLYFEFSHHKSKTQFVSSLY